MLYAFLYISLPSLYDHNVKVPNSTFSGGREHRQRISFAFCELWYSLLGFNSRKICQHLTNWKRCGISAIKFETVRIHFLSDWQWRFCNLKLRSTPNLSQEKHRVKVTVKSCFQLNIYTRIDLEMTSKLSKLETERKWKVETQAAGLQASADFTAKFWTVLRHFSSWKEWRLLGIVFDLFFSVLIWRCLFYLGKSFKRGRQM